MPARLEEVARKGHLATQVAGLALEVDALDGLAVEQHLGPGRDAGLRGHAHRIGKRHHDGPRVLGAQPAIALPVHHQPANRSRHLGRVGLHQEARPHGVGRRLGRHVVPGEPLCTALPVDQRAGPGSLPLEHVPSRPRPLRIARLLIGNRGQRQPVVREAVALPPKLVTQVAIRLSPVA
ncbi:hypothetical protein D3C87_1405390 [compost metagenome]